MSTAPVAASVPQTRTHWWTNCTALHNRWLHGVGRVHAVDHTSGAPVTNFKHSNYWFGIAMQHNRGLDRDRDRIACEKR